MKGLSGFPGTLELSQAYEKLQAHDGQVDERELALWSQWTRFDPRLGEQLVSHLSAHWKDFSPLLLRECLLSQPWPQVFGVLTEQVLEFGSLESLERGLFRKWRDMILADVSPALGEQFFIGLRKFAGRQMLEDAIYSTKSYLRWGYLGREILVNKAKARLRTGKRTLLPARTRRSVLDSLIRTRHSLTVLDYREALDFQVSARQAELDLAKDPRLQSWGNTRGRVYRKKRH